VTYHGQALELIDTAGVRRQGKQEVGIEKFSVLRTIAAIEESDICLLLMDVGELNTQLDQRLAGMIAEAGKGLVLVVSKWDAVEGKDAYTRDALAPKIANNFDFVPWAPLIFTSSVTGQNVAKLLDLAPRYCRAPSAAPPKHASSTICSSRPSPSIRQLVSKTPIQSYAISYKPTPCRHGL
jgi:GTP-binding protein